MSDPVRPADDPRFTTKIALDELWAHAFASGAASVTGQVGGFLLRICATLVLARLLTPADYGVVAIAVAAAAFVALFKDLGLAQAAIQGATLSHDQVSTLFWINAANGLALTLLSAAAAPLLGWLFGDARVTQAALGLAPIHLFAGLAAQHQAVLRRQLRLKTLTALDVCAVLAGVVAAIAVARAGAGFWALVLMQGVIGFASAAGALAFSGLRPGRPVRGAGLRPMLAFGSHVTALGVSSYLARNVDSLLIGHRFGAHALGLYDKAYQLMLVPSQLVTMPLSGVAISVLSRVQSDVARFREYYRLFLRMSVGLTMPLSAFLFVTADRVIPLLLGPQWTPSVPLFRALAPAAFGDGLTATAGWIFISLGRTRRQVGFSLASSLITALAFVVALPFGPFGVALALTACRLALPLPTLLFTCPETPIAWSEPLALAAPPALASLVSAWLLDRLGPAFLPTLGVSGVLASALAFGILYALLVGSAFMLPRLVATAEGAALMPRRLRLGILSDEFFDPRLGRVGGFGWATRELVRLFQGDPALGVDVVLLTNELGATGARCELMVHACRLLLRDPSPWRQLRRLRAERLDLVLTIDYNLGFRFFFRALARTPFVVWSRDPRTPEDRARIETLRIPGDATPPRGIEFVDGRSLAGTLRWSRAVGRRALLAATSPHLIAKFAGAYGASPPEAFLLPNVIEVLPDPIAKSSTPSVLFLGRLDPYKRPWLFVELAGRFPEVQFVLAGQAHFSGPGGWEPRVVPANVRLLGHVDGEAKRSALASAWLLVNTSIHEGLAVSFLEALAAGTPIVSGEDPDGVVSRFGIPVGCWNGDGRAGLPRWEAALSRLLEDHVERTRLGAEGRAWVVAHHSRERFLEAFFALVERAGARRD